jgi:hypothetical protein
MMLPNEPNILKKDDPLPLRFYHIFEISIHLIISTLFYYCY